MSAEKEVLILFAGTRGFLDPYPVSAVAEYEKDMFEFMEATHPGILKELRELKDISPELDARIKEALTEFASVFHQGA